MARNILLTISYDGTDFCGWQRQDASKEVREMRTVQGEVERALQKLFSKKIDLHGSGRTDSGVHARGQAANFFCPIESIPAQNIARALNNFLPRDVRVNSACEVSENFSARFSATSRVYRYFILPDEIPCAAASRFVWQIKKNPEIETLSKMALILKGEIDFATFAASGDKSVSTFRYVEGARFFFQEDLFGQKLLVFEIEANAILWKMVRSLVGTLIEFERDGGGEEKFKYALESRQRKNAGPTAPPNGLFLWQVKFDGTRRNP